MHGVYQNKGDSSLVWDIFRGACSQWGEVASTLLTKSNHFALKQKSYLKYGMSYWPTLLKLKDHLIPNILIPHLIRLAKTCEWGDYCWYANGPK